MSETTTLGGVSQRQPARPSLDEVHVDDLLRAVVDKGGSDLHLCVGVPPIIRIDGQLTPAPYERVTPADSQRMSYDILTDEQIQKFESTLELDFSYSVARVARFRVNLYRDKGSVAAAFRVIPQVIPSVDDLHGSTRMPPESSYTTLGQVLIDLSRKPRGLILVTGPTGSGKSTTLAAIINQINTERSVHILTIEDPIEYLHQHRYSIINQRELGMDTKNFPNALRAALREDPDVILVGEMRDQETMALAVTAAETGHLVFATVHTNSAASTVDRIVDVFPPGQQEQIRVQLSNNLQAILTQQLLPRAGKPGRVCAMEVLVANAAVRNLIREGKSHQITSALQTSAKEGMMTMDRCLAQLYQSGQITLDDAISRAMSPDELRKMIAGPVGGPGGGAGGRPV